MRTCPHCGGHLAGTLTAQPLTPTEQAALIDAVTTATGVPAAIWCSKQRSRRAVTARRVAVHVMRQHLGLSFPEIGRVMDQDHTTALHASRGPVDAALVDRAWDRFQTVERNRADDNGSHEE